MRRTLPFFTFIFVSHFLYAQSLSVSFSGQTLCGGKVEKVGFQSTGTFNQSNYFKVQLSDSSGSFATPIELVRFLDGSFQNVSFVLPNQVPKGNHYKIRAVSTSPVVVSQANSLYLAVVDTCTTLPNSPSLTLQNLGSNLLCTGSTVSISWSIVGGTFASNNSFTVQLSDSSGTFISPLNLAVATANDSTKNIIVPTAFLEGTKYRIRIIATNPSFISNNSSNLSIHAPPQASITFLSAKPCIGAPVTIIANDGGLVGSNYLWSGLGSGTNDTLQFAAAGIINEGNYTVQVSRYGCSAVASKELVLLNCQPTWGWALADTFWTSTFKYPSTIVDTEVDSENNLFIAGFFSQRMDLGSSSIHTIVGNNAFCDDSLNTEKRTGFLAKISASGELSWFRKWNSLSETGDYQYCDLAIDEGQIFLISEYNAAAYCDGAPRNQASLVITDEEDFSLGSLIGYCRYAIPNSSPTQYNYRYKGRFTWAAKFDLSGNLEALSNLTELKSCGSSTANFDSRPTYGLGTKGYYSLKARNGKLWLLYTWNSGLVNAIKFTNGNVYTNEGAGLVVAQLNISNLTISKFEKIIVNSPNGALGLSNLDIDTQDNIVVTGSSATPNIGSAWQMNFGSLPLSFGDADYFVAKYNTTSNSWAWAKKSQLAQVNTNNSTAPSIKIDSQNNIYLGISLKPSGGGNFAGLALPTTPQDFDGNKAAALLKINANGDGQWVRLNNHLLQAGRNQLGIDFENNIYFASYLTTSDSSKYFLIGDHRLEQKNLSLTRNASGTPFVAIYKPSGSLLGSVNNIRVDDALLLNGLVIDNYKNIILSGQNYGNADFSQLSLKTNFGNQTDTSDNRKRAFMVQIANPQSIALDSVSAEVCSTSEAQIKFKTAGSFINNTEFKVELIDTGGHIMEVATGFSSPIAFTPPDSMGNKSYYVRVSTTDNGVIGTFRTENKLQVKSTPRPLILSSTLGTASPQSVCNTSLASYRIQAGIGGHVGTLTHNGNVVYVGNNTDFAPNEQQSGIYKVTSTVSGCTGESENLELKIFKKPTAQLIGTQVVSNINTPVYLSVIMSGGGTYNLNIAGAPAPFNLNNNYETITVTPTQSTNYTIASISNFCGTGAITGSANVTLCPNSLALQNPTNNYSGGNVLNETSAIHGQITANNHLLNQAKVVYNAGKSIMLTPGFSTSNAVTFKAEIKGCKGVVSDADPNFKLGYQKLHIYIENNNQTITEMTEFAQKGANLFEVTVRLDEVFKSLSQFNETDTTLINHYWEVYDKVIRHASNIYDYVGIRIGVDYDDTRYYFQDRDELDPNQQVYNNYENALFNLFTEIVQDQFGNPARVAYGSGHGSFASTSAKAKMKGFVQKVIDRYYPVLKEKLYWVSVVTTGQYETGYNYENSWTGSGFISPRLCEYDYTPENVDQFRNWLVTQRYSGLGGVNAAYGQNYSNQSQIQPPKVNVSSLDQMTQNGLLAMYNSVLFEDWYKFNYNQKKAFMIECKDIIKAKDNKIKFCLETGSSADQLSVARKTFNIPDANSYSDILKTNLANIGFNGQHNWEGDVVRSNYYGEIETEINEADLVNIGGITDPAIVKQKMLEYSKMSYLNKAKSIIFVSDKNTQYYNNSLDALAELKSWINNHTEQLTEGQTINVNLSQLIRNFPGAIAPFNSIAPSLPTNGYQNRPKVIINQNL